MSTYELLADLPVVIEGYELEGHEVALSPEFVRKTTVIRLRGSGEEGLGEDVTYAVEDQEALQRAGAIAPLAGRWTLGSFAEHLRSLDLFPQPTERPEFRLYRNWAFDSAALDLALRQAGTTLHAALGRECEPLRFVASLRLGEPPSLEPLLRRLEIAPELRFKLDPTPSWDEELIARLVELGAVDSVDLKGQYEGTIVDNPADPELYRRVVDAFADAWIEDPKLTPETEEILRAHRSRVTWDAPIHSGRGHPGAALAAADDQRQALAPRRPAIAAGRLRLLRGERDRLLRRRAVGAERRARADPVPRLALPRRRAQRRRAVRLQPARAAARPALQPAPALALRGRLPLAVTDRPAARSRLHPRGSTSADVTGEPNATSIPLLGLGRHRG